MNIVGSLFLFFGVFFMVLAGLGIVRMPTFFMRMQAASKASALGVLLIFAGSVMISPSWESVLKSLAIVTFLLISTPIATHALAESARQRNYDK